MTFGVNLIVYFGYCIIENTSNMRTSHLNTINSNQLALSRIHVDFIGRMHLLFCSFALPFFVCEISLLLRRSVLHFLQN